MHKTDELICGAIESLTNSGLLRYVGSSVRFSSDFNGNVYLSTVLDEPNGAKVTEELFERWLPLASERIACNIADAARNAESSGIRDAVSKLIRGIIISPGNTNPLVREVNLIWVKYLVFVAPDQVADLLFTYLGLQASPDEMSRDSYGPVVSNLMHVPGFQQHALEFIRDIKTRNIKGIYSNYEPANLVRSAVSPIELGNTDTAISSLQVLDDWAANPPCDEDAAHLIIAGVKEALGGSHEYNDSYGGTMTFGRRSLSFSPKVSEYRNVAMAVYRKILSNNKRSVKVRAISIFDDIGRGALQTKGAFWERIIADKQQALGWISELIFSEELPHSVLAEAENVLIHLWSENEVYPDLSTQAERLLGMIVRSPEFLAIADPIYLDREIA